MSVSERGAAADDLAGFPARGGGELPEQGIFTTAVPFWVSTAVTVIRIIVLK